MARYRSGKQADVTAGVNGTNYLVANPAVATIDANGRLTAVASGSTLLTVRKDGVAVAATVFVVTSGDTDGDGIPDDIELANGLDPNDPVDGFEDQDGDGLSARDEYALGTNMRLADTDGDGVNDGLEVSLGTDPNDPLSVDFSALHENLSISPKAAALFYNTIDGESSIQTTVVARVASKPTVQKGLTLPTSRAVAAVLAWRWRMSPASLAQHCVLRAGASTVRLRSRVRVRCTVNRQPKVMVIWRWNGDFTTSQRGSTQIEHVSRHTIRRLSVLLGKL